jgi:CRP-like cAMP-binding protein
MISSPRPEANECELDCNLRVLRELPFFAGVPPELQRVMAYLCEREVFAPGQTVLAEGQPADAAMAVISGSLVIEREGLAIGRVTRGMCAGGLALLGVFRSLYTLRAETQAECLIMQRRTLLPQLVARPEALAGVVRELVGSVVLWDQQRLERGVGPGVHGPGVL